MITVNITQSGGQTIDLETGNTILTARGLTQWDTNQMLKIVGTPVPRQI